MIAVIALCICLLTPQTQANGGGGVCYPMTVWCCSFYNSGGDYVGGSAGTDEPNGDIGAPPTAATGSMAVEKRVYDENMVEYTVIESVQYTITF